MLLASEITPIENLGFEAYLEKWKEVTNVLNDELLLSEEERPVSVVFNLVNGLWSLLS